MINDKFLRYVQSYNYNDSEICKHKVYEFNLIVNVNVPYVLSQLKYMMFISRIILLKLVVLILQVCLTSWKAKKQHQTKSPRDYKNLF